MPLNDKRTIDRSSNTCTVKQMVTRSHNSREGETLERRADKSASVRPNMSPPDSDCIYWHLTFSCCRGNERWSKRQRINCCQQAAAAYHSLTTIAASVTQRVTRQSLRQPFADHSADGRPIDCCRCPNPFENPSIAGGTLLHAGLLCVCFRCWAAESDGRALCCSVCNLIEETGEED